MLYGHVVAALEGYLASTFIDKVTSPNNSKLLRKVVESDPKFNKDHFKLREIFEIRERLENIIKKHLREVIFHKIDKVKSMYKSVLDIDFGDDIKWLFQAVLLRHDCVHRAGYDKEGEEIEINSEIIENLITRCSNLVIYIEGKLK